ncbi:MAG: lytic transglycosylase domain-containing protein [Nitrospirota bacterium]
MCRVGLILLLMLFIFVPKAYSDIYKYTDENGVVCYTDAPFGKKTERVIRQRKIIENNEVQGVKYSGYVHKAAVKYQIEPELIHAVIKTESNGNHRAVSRKGAMGLMQLMPSTASDMNVGNPFNPEENIDGGTKYLKYLLEKFNGNLTLALAAYNSGPKTVEKYGSVPPISETRQYVNKIFSIYRGKRVYTVTDSETRDKTTPIYKIVLDDGTILFTNSPLAKNASIRF